AHGHAADGADRALLLVQSGARPRGRSDLPALPGGGRGDRLPPDCRLVARPADAGRVLRLLRCPPAAHRPRLVAGPARVERSTVTVPDRQLLIRARDGDRAARDELIERYMGLARALAR